MAIGTTKRYARWSETDHAFLVRSDTTDFLVRSDTTDATWRVRVEWTVGAPRFRCLCDCPAGANYPDRIVPCRHASRVLESLARRAWRGDDIARYVSTRRRAA